MTLDFNSDTIGYIEEGSGEVHNQNKTFTINGTYTADEGYTGLGTVTVNVSGGTEPTLATLTVNPSTTTQTLTVSGSTDGYNTVLVDAVTASIDSDISASNIKSGVNILGVDGTVTELVGTTTTITANGTYTPLGDANGFTSVSVNVSGTAPTLVTKTITTNGTYAASSDNADGYSSVSVDVEPTIATLSVTPTTTAQTFTVPSGTDGYNPVSVSAVTSAIDSNITAGNIKSGTSILGVSGTVTELVGTTTTITSNGTYAPTDGANGFTSVSVNVAGTTPTGTYTITTNGTYDVTDYATADVNVSGGGGSAVGDIKREVVSGVYTYPTTPFTFKFPDDVTKIGKAVCYAMFGNSDYSTNPSSTGLTSVDFNNIKILDQQACLCSAFYGCTNLTTIKADNLESLTANYVLAYAFKYCTSLETVRFPKLYTTGTNISQLNGAFAYCTNLKNIYFPALTTSSNGCWTNMLQGVTGCTVHFPSAMQSTMSSWQVVTSGFGGTNTSVLFDL